MAEAIGSEGEDHAGEDRGRLVLRQVPGERAHADPRRTHAPEQHQVVNEQRRYADRQQRRPEDPLHQDRVRVTEHALFGIELVPVEQVSRRRRERVVDPLQAPQVEVDVEVIDAARDEVKRHRPRHHHGEQNEEGADGQPAQPRSGILRLGRFHVTNHSRSVVTISAVLQSRWTLAKICVADCSSAEGHSCALAF